MGRKLQLKVIKADGSLEGYFHTKVLNTINSALGCVGGSDLFVAEQLAEVVTYYLYGSEARHSVSSGEILGIIKVVLASTGNEEAAELLSEHHNSRKLKRSRIEVIHYDTADVEDARFALCRESEADRSRWDKSIIVNDLVSRYGVERGIAHAIASIVEEKVFGLGVRQVVSSLIGQLVLSEAGAILNASGELSEAAVSGV